MLTKRLCIFVIVSGLVVWVRAGSAQEDIHLDFEDVPSGSAFVHPLHPTLGGPSLFQTSGVTVELADYFFASCTVAPDTRTCGAQCASTCPWREGRARVDTTGAVGAGGNEVQVVSVNLEFIFAKAEVIELRYAWAGGDVNIAINGRFRNAGDVHDLDTQVVGGYRIQVMPDVILLTPETEPFMTSFAIGGQELFIDDVILLNAARISSPDRFEPNDSFDQATDLGLAGERGEGALSIHETDDEDFFAVGTSAPGNLHVEVLFRHEIGDLDMALYNGAREEIFRSESRTDDEVISIPVDGEETFYIRVYGFEGATNAHYDLFVIGPSGGAPGQHLFVRADSNTDLDVNISDGAHILNFLFLGTPTVLDCEDAADVNDDGVLNIADAIRLFGRLFAGDPPPPPPTGECGPDPTPDDLGCVSHPRCPPDGPSVLPIETLGRIAGGHAREVWEGDLTPGEPVPYSHLDGREFGYVFPFVRGRERFPEHEEILAAVRELKEGLGPLPEAGPEPLPPAFYTALEQRLGEIGSIDVSASLENFPILMVRKSLHPYFLYLDSARERAAGLLGREDVRLERLILIGPHEQYFEFVADPRRILMHVFTFETATLEELAARGTFEVPPELVEAKDRAWEEVLDANRPPDGRGGAHTVKRIKEWQLVPPVNWTSLCDATAATMVASFWDNYEPGPGTKMGYGRIVDYWYESAFGNNVPNFQDEIMDPLTSKWTSQGFLGTLNNTNGYQFTSPSVVGKSANGWAWSVLKSEIDVDRPVKWGVSPPVGVGHSLAAFGYRIAGWQKFVITYNTYGVTKAAQYAEYNYDQWIFGGPASRTSVQKVIPGGGTGNDHAVLTAPDGGEVLYGASEILWYVWGTAITKTDLYHSTDAGKTWQFLATVPITSGGSKKYAWTPPTTTNKGRVRIACYDATGTLIAADGSQTNFFVQQKADLVPVGPAPYCGYDAQGRLVVKVANQGQAAAPASTTRVNFRGTNVSLPTPALSVGGSVEVYADIPSSCWEPDCSFTITVDSGKDVGEANEANNVAQGVCFS